MPNLFECALWAAKSGIIPLDDWMRELLKRMPSRKLGREHVFAGKRG